MNTRSNFFQTGVHGLDQVLGGGFLIGRIYLIEGAAGTGKTILGNQLAFTNASAGEKSVIVTLIAETHDRMIEQNQIFDFFDSNYLGELIVYLSGLNELSHEGLDGFKKFLLKAIRLNQAKILIIDGFKLIRNFAKDQIEYEKFLHNLAAIASTLDCSIFIIVGSTEKISQEEYIAVDGAIELKRIDVGMRNIREIHIHKMRGVSHYEGSHELRISKIGIQIFPRAELIVALLNPFHPKLSEKKLSFGITYLDQMLNGGVLSGSVTSLFGPPGAGKTLLGLSFLHEGLKNGEKSLYFGFYETRDQMLSRAKSIGLDFSTYLKSEDFLFEWFPPTEQLIDELFEKLVNLINDNKINRVFIDGIEGFKISAVFSDRLPRFIASLTIKLRSLGITAIISEEARLPSDVRDYHSGEYSAAFENIIYLRYIETEYQVKRLINIYKVRSSSYDIAIHQFNISNHGIVVEEDSFKPHDGIK